MHIRRKITHFIRYSYVGIKMYNRSSDKQYDCYGRSTVHIVYVRLSIVNVINNKTYRHIYIRWNKNVLIEQIKINNKSTIITHTFIIHCRMRYFLYQKDVYCCFFFNRVFNIYIYIYIEPKNSNLKFYVIF